MSKQADAIVYEVVQATIDRLSPKAGIGHLVAELGVKARSRKIKKWKKTSRLTISGTRATIERISR